MVVSIILFFFKYNFMYFSLCSCAQLYQEAQQTNNVNIPVTLVLYKNCFTKVVPKIVQLVMPPLAASTALILSGIEATS